MKKLALVALVSSMSLSAFAEVKANNKNAWDGWNNPYKIDANFENRLDSLPTSGQLEGTGLAWPGYYWANNKGGVAQRWSAKNPQHFKYDSPSMYEAQNMSADKLNEMSPAEKYDLFTGNYDYPTVDTIWNNTRPGASVWHGICHGVAPASLNHSEPKPVTLTNPDGVKVTFYSSDVKALLAYYYAKVSDSGIIQVGKRCFVGARVPIANRSAGCRDVNPGSMHIIMANKLGISKTGYVADMDRYRQVWNHAAVSFESKIMGSARLDKNAVTSAVKRVRVKSKVKYSASIDPSSAPVIATNLAKYDTRTYSYYLELNSKGEIVGGSWISKDRPDFMWVKEKETFTGYWEQLYEVYKPTK